LVPRAQGTERRTNIREVATADYVSGSYDGSRGVWPSTEGLSDSEWVDLLADGGTVFPPLYYEVWDIEKIPAPQSVLDAAKREGRARIVEIIKISKNATSIEDCCNAGLLPWACADYFNADGTKKQIEPPGFKLTEQAKPGEEGDAPVDEELRRDLKGGLISHT
jgi:hypothetical protein